MPFTLYGILLLFPSVFFYKKIFVVNKFKKIVYITYIVHYLTIDKMGGLITMIYTAPSLYYAIEHQYYLTKNQAIFRGLFFMVVALGIQELFGHYISGDPPSRKDAILNAIIYAPYFCINAIIYTPYF